MLSVVMEALERVAMCADRTHASVKLTGSPELVHDRVLQSDDLRKRADRYRRLAETMLTPDVIAVVLDCARDLEMEAGAAAADDRKRAKR